MIKKRMLSFIESIIDRYRIRYALRYFERGSYVLDIGCGRAIDSIPDKKYDYYCGVDINKSLINDLRYRYPQYDFYVIDLENDELDLNFDADVILMLAFIEHIGNPYKVLRECYRHLKNDGILIITTPTKKGDNLLNFILKIFSDNEKDDEHPHCKIYDRALLEDVLTGVGFNVIKYEKFELG